MSPTITGTRAQARFVRMSAKKVRPVLDLVRGEPIQTADEILQFTSREAARAVRKVLKSAAANAVNNDSLPVEELFIAACYADEGPTIKRFRPRARGRATRINKRTCHITVVVDRMPADELARYQQRQVSSGQSGADAAARARRVAASRGDEVAEDEVTEDEVDETVDAEATDAVEEVTEEATEATDAVEEVTEEATETDEAVAEVAETEVADDEDSADETVAEADSTEDDEDDEDDDATKKDA